MSVQGQESELSCICVLEVSVFASVLGFYGMISELFWQCGIFLHDFGTVLTVWYFPIWFRNCSDSVVFSDIISELFWQCGIFLQDFGTALTVFFHMICTRPGKWTVMYLCVRSIGVCLSSRILPHDFGTVLTLWYFLHDFGTVLTVWYFFTWFRNCSDSLIFFLHNFGTVLRVWYFSAWFRNCSDSGIFRYDF